MQLTPQRRTRLLPLLLWPILLVPSPAMPQAALYVLGGQQDSTLIGPEEEGSLGISIVVGDLNGDGRSDILAGASTGSWPPRYGAGVVYLFLGRDAWPGTWDLASRPADSTFWGGDRWDELALGAAGDLDGDRLDDLVLVAPYADGPDDVRATAGEAYLFFHRESWPAVVDLAADLPDTVVYGDEATTVRYANIADLDGDGAGDLILSGGSGEVLVFRGGASWPPVLDLRDAVPDIRIVETDCYLQHHVADVSGDALPDLLLRGCMGWGGKVVFGRLPWPSFLDLSVTPADLTFSSDRAAILAGNWIGDGTADIAASRFGASRRGEIRIYTGGPALDTDFPDFILHGRDNDIIAVEAAADLDGDGGDELLFVAESDGARNRFRNAGEVSVLRGPLAPGEVWLAERFADLTVFGADEGDRVIRAAAGDFDGDTSTDLAVAAIAADGPGDSRDGSGEIYLFLAPDFTPTPASDVHVDAVLGDDANDGLSWASAKRSLADALSALDLTLGSVKVRVAQGRYTGPGVVGSATTLLGGYPSGGGARDPGLHPTVADGAGEGTAVTIRAGDGVERSRLDGFVVTGGRALAGAGMVARGGEVQVTNNLITGNTAVALMRNVAMPCTDGFGNFWTGYYCDKECVGTGTGLVISATAIVTNNLVHANRVEFLVDCDPKPAWMSCTESPCGSFGKGGGIEAFGGGVRIENNTVTRNEGRGVFLMNSAQLPVVQNNIFVSNTGDDLLTWQPEAVRYNLVGTTNTTLDGTNLRDDPLFVDAEGHDFRLSHIAAGQPADSPAVDTGGAPASAVCTDPDGSLCLDTLTTRTDLVPDAGPVDIGFHYFPVPNGPPVFAGLREVAAAGDCALLLSWDGAADPEGHVPVRYAVFRSETPEGQDFVSPLALVTDPARSFLDDTVLWATTYYYAVRAEDALGRREKNAVEVPGTPEDSSPPEVVSLNAWESPACWARVSFELEDPCSGVSRVELHRSPTPGFTPDPSTLVATDPRSPYSDPAPGNGFFYYRLVVEDMAGNSTPSEEVLVRVDGCAGPVPVPGQAAFLRVARVTGGLYFWLRAANGADFHRIYRGTLAALVAGRYDHASSDTTGAGLCRVDSTSVVDPDELAAGSFYYLVTGVNATGEGLFGSGTAGTPRPDGSTLGTLDCP